MYDKLYTGGSITPLDGAVKILLGVIICIIVLIAYFYTTLPYKGWLAACGVAYGLYTVSLGAVYVNPITNLALNTANAFTSAPVNPVEPVVFRTPVATREPVAPSAPTFTGTGYSADEPVDEPVDKSLDESVDESVNSASNHFTHEHLHERKIKERADNMLGGSKKRVSYSEEVETIPNSYNEKIWDDTEQDHAHGSGLLDNAMSVITALHIDSNAVIRAAISHIASNPVARQYIEQARAGIYKIDTVINDLTALAEHDTTGKIRETITKLQAAISTLHEINNLLPPGEFTDKK